MTASVSCCNLLCALGGLQLGSWTLETSDRGGQDKANWRSRTRRPFSDREPFVCTLVLRTAATGAQRRSGEGGWHRSNFSNNLNAQRDGARGVHFGGLHILFRSRARG